MMFAVYGEITNAQLPVVIKCVAQVPLLIAWCHMTSRLMTVMLHARAPQTVVLFNQPLYIHFVCCLEWLILRSLCSSSGITLHPLYNIKCAVCIVMQHYEIHSALEVLVGRFLDTIGPFAPVSSLCKASWLPVAALYVLCGHKWCRLSHLIFGKNANKHTSQIDWRFL